MELLDSPVDFSGYSYSCAVVNRHSDSCRRDEPPVPQTSTTKPPSDDRQRPVCSGLARHSIRSRRAVYKSYMTPIALFYRPQISETGTPSRWGCGLLDDKKNGERWEASVAGDRLSACPPTTCWSTATAREFTAGEGDDCADTSDITSPPNASQA